MTKDRHDRIVIEIYGNGKFQGYLKSIGRTKNWFDSTNAKMNAKTYASLDTAKKDMERISVMTKGAVTCIADV